MTASDFVYADNSRANISMTEKSGEFAWTKHDTVGVFHHTGALMYLPMANGAGAKTAVLDDGGWVL